MFRCVWLLFSVALCFSVQGCSSDLQSSARVSAKAKSTVPHRPSPSSKAPFQWSSGQAQARTVSAISGEQGDAYSRTIIDLTEVLRQSQLRFRPISSQGPRQDLLDLLYRPDIDVAVVQTDALESLETRSQAAARERLRYLFRVPNRELHVVASRAITDIRQLEGRKVNIDRPESSTHLTARLVFEKLGIKPDFTTHDQFTARNSLKSGEIQAAVVLASRPSAEVLVFPFQGFHLLSIPLEEGIRNYIPGRLTANDYPHLVEAGSSIETVAVGRILAVRDWPAGSARYKRLTRLTEALHGRLEELQKAGHDLGWRNVDPLEPAPGWQRFKPAQDLLHQRAKQADERRACENSASTRGLCSPALPAAHERI
jgi:TRAP-type uncharacterized transport system substrate-binding protein